MRMIVQMIFHTFDGVVEKPVELHVDGLMLSPATIDKVMEEAKLMILAVRTHQVAPRYATLEDAQQQINAVPPLIGIATTIGVREGLNPVWVRAPYSVTVAPIRRACKETATVQELCAPDKQGIFPQV